MNLLSPIIELNHVGEIQAKKLKNLKINTVGDLLFYFPSQYQDLSKINTISNLKINEDDCICGKIIDLKEQKTSKQRMSLTKALIQDKTGNVELIWFNQPFVKKNIKVGDKIIVSGKLKFKDRTLYFSPVIYEKLKEELIHLGNVMPVYKETRGLSSKYLRFILKPVIDDLIKKIPETLPSEIIQKYNLLDFKTALKQIHFPDNLEMAKKAKYRFTFEQLFFISLFSQKKKSEIKNEKAQNLEIKNIYIERIKDSLPYKLTKAQEKVIKQILKDLSLSHPMNRLTQGDVGSGKTVVAAICALNCIKNKTQVVLMAPTEILAKQHFKTIFDILKNFHVNIGLLTGKEDKYYSYKLKNETIEISRNKLLENCKNGKIDMLIGTQALIVKKDKDNKPKVLFKNLGLVVIDEQHRFGVRQRKELCLENNEKIPHLLSMTATPIPRSLSLTVWGDLDLSIIDELPKGRKKIITEIVLPIEEEKTYKLIGKELKKGRQCFVICPRIEENEDSKLNLKNVLDEYEHLKKVFPDFNVDMLHGKMKPKEKEEIMKNFKKKKNDVLVSTSVIEVGIDVPNATVILIEGADRFGLAQLHQFRGRVGRGKHQSYCFLKSDSLSKNTVERLKAMKKYSSGFKLSEIDLKLRGPGDFTGIKQWGFSDYVMEALRDIKLVEIAREAAKEIFPNLKNYPITQKRLDSFEEKIHFE